MHGHTVGPTDLKLGTEDSLSPVKVYGGSRSGSEAAVEAANAFQPGAKSRHSNSDAGGRAERRSGNKQSQNPAPSMARSEQIARKVMNDHEMKLELASEAVGRPATRAVHATHWEEIKICGAYVRKYKF